MTNFKTMARNLTKLILIVAIGSISFAAPSFALYQTPTGKEDKAQKKDDKKTEKLDKTQHKVDKKQVKMDKKESRMDKKNRKVDALQKSVNK